MNAGGIDSEDTRGVAPHLQATQRRPTGPSPAAAPTGPREASTGAPGVAPRGATIGRYVVLAQLGEGAMGVVLAAYDPDLDRKVALKLVRPHSGAGAVGETRLLREAQALARLSHPNVVAIHDVGLHAGQVWIAME